MNMLHTRPYARRFLDAREATLRVLLLSMLTLLAAGTAAAEYPDKPIKLIVPFSPGGLTDTGARLVAERLGQALGQQVLVDNRPGAGGNIGAQAASTAAADGYTLLLGFDGTLVINPHVYAKVPFDPIKDFTPVAKIGDVAGVIVINPSIPAKTFQELVAYSKSRPEGVSYGSSGVGGSGHLIVEMLDRRVGSNFVHIPYKGGGQAMADVVSGTLQMNSTSVATALPFIKQGQVRAVAVFASQRIASLPDVPTITEAGVSGFGQSSWIGILAPAKTPQPVLEKLQTALNKVLAAPELKERLATLGIFTSTQTPADFGKQIRTELDSYAAIVKAAGIKLD